MKSKPRTPTEYVVAFDAHCSCGAALVGELSAFTCERWADEHEHDTPPPTPKKGTPTP